MARKKTSTKRKRAASAVLPRTAAKAALDRATKDIRALRRRASANAWAIGRRLAQVAELELHRARGYDSLEAYADEELQIPREQLYLSMRVAQAFTETVAQTFGPEKLDRALRYIAATPEDETPKDIPTLRVRVRGADGETQTKRFEDVTISELRRATQAERGKKRRNAPEWLDASAADVLERGRRALDRAVGKKAAAGADLFVRKEGDVPLVDVHGIPLDKLPAVLRALAAAVK